MINFAVHQVRAGSAGAREDFEQMIGLLVRATLDQNTKLTPAPASWAVDSLLGDLGGYVTAWQPKYFMQGVRRAQQDQIASSFTTAVKAAADHGYALERWVLCIPSSMDGPAAQWWHGWRRKQEDKTGVIPDLWDESVLRELLLRPEAAETYRRYYAPSLQVQVDLGGEDIASIAPSSLAARSRPDGANRSMTSRAGAEPQDKGVSGANLDSAAGVQVGSGNFQVNIFYGNQATVSWKDPPGLSAHRKARSLQRGHAFISYVREDSNEVDVLQRALQAAGIPVWRDTASLWPGEDWKSKIRDAITHDALVFIACFPSTASHVRRATRTRSFCLLSTSYDCADRMIRG